MPGAAPPGRTGSAHGRSDFRWLMMSDVCKHCTRAGCLDVCPTGALFRTEFGTVVVQEDICNGCGYCVSACPYGVIDRRAGDGRAWKCTLCYDRIGAGMTPACAQACPTESIQYGPLDELRDRAAARVATLHERGVPEARLYGHDPSDGVGGDGAFFLLLDEPEVYGLPPDPQVHHPGPAADVAACRVGGAGHGGRSGRRVPGRAAVTPRRPPVGERFRRFRDRLRAAGVTSAPSDDARTAPGPTQRSGRRRARRAGPGRRPGRAAAGRRRGRGGEELAVPPAEFSSYYGRPILKPPVWTWEIAAYLFTGGLAAGSSLLAAGAQLTGRPALRRAGRLTALAGVTASGVLLVKDLGRPERFHHMLRVAKLTSPMSVGTWILTAYGPVAGLAAVAEAAPLLPERGPLGVARRMLPPVGRAAGLAAAGIAPALGTYTAVLLSDTAVPSWHAAYPELPLVFAGSALASGAGMGLIAVPPAQAGPARRLAVAGAGLELFGAHRVQTRLGLVSRAVPCRARRPAAGCRAGADRGGGGRRAARCPQPGRLGGLRRRPAGRVGGHPVRGVPRRGRLGPGSPVHGAAAAGATPAAGRRAGPVAGLRRASVHRL